VLAAVVFVGLGVWSLQMALGEPGCPPVLLWGNRQYTATGQPTGDPVVGDGEPVLLGSTLVGAVTREVYGPEGSTPPPDPDDLPDDIALACGDGTYVSYRYSTELPSPVTSP
jgi:hypothetical protein